MTNILIAVQQQLATVSALNYTDEDWGQLDDYGPNAPVQWPCGLVDVNTIQYSNIGPDRTVKPMQRQEGTATISIVFANLKLSNSSSKAPASQRQNAFMLSTVMEAAHEVLQGFRPDDKGGVLIRTAFQKVKRDDGVQMYRVIYSVGLHNV